MITRLSILGSTGSIGTQTIDVVNQHSSSFTVFGLAAGGNVQLLKEQITKFHPQAVSVANQPDAIALIRSLRSKSPKIYWGDEGNIAIAKLSGVDKVVIATPGFYGIRPTIAAIENKKIVALATKEVLVAAGLIINKELAKHQTTIIPIDSEHSAIFQCLQGYSIDQVAKIYLTCSGGPFRGKKLKDLKKVTKSQALTHPNWKMGQKITTDSATLMNKGFEVIEAHWLFGIPIEKIKVVVHPQSVIHSAVEFIDGSIIAQIGPADMRLPIQYALFHPAARQPNHFKRFSFEEFPNLTFEQPDTKTFRALTLAYDAIKAGGTMPAVLNAANDIATAAFLEEKIPFLKIPEIVEKTLSKHKSLTNPTLDDIFATDRWAREYATHQLITRASMIDI